MLFSIIIPVIVIYSLNHVQLFATPWTIAHQDSLSMEFPRQEYQSGLPFPPPGDLLDPGVEPTSPGSPALAGRFFTTEPPGKSLLIIYLNGHLWLVAMILDSSAVSIVLQLGFNPVRNMHILLHQYICSVISIIRSSPSMPGSWARCFLWIVSFNPHNSPVGICLYLQLRKLSHRTGEYLSQVHTVSDGGAGRGLNGPRTCALSQAPTGPLHSHAFKAA